MNETEYNKLGTFNILDIVKLIIERSELDELKELVVVSKYFNSIVYDQFPKLRKAFIILREYSKINNIISKNDPNSYLNIQFKQIDRKLYDFVSRLLRKNNTSFVNKIINHIDKYNPPELLIDTTYYYRLFQVIILENYTNEQILLTNFIKISPFKVNWSILTDFYEHWIEDLQIDHIIITILDLLKAAIFLNNEDLIVTLIKCYYKHDLDNWEDEKTDVVLFELNHLIKSLEQSSDVYGDIEKHVEYI